MPFLFLVIAFVLNGTANIILKSSAHTGFQFSGLTFAEIITKNFYFGVGLVLFAINVIFYFLALRSIPISVAYPVMVIMSFLIINAYAYFFLGERITLAQGVGYFFVIIGIIIIFYFSGKK